MTSQLPRSEYPRPQFVRPDWLCLNGEWQFEIDPGDSGLERGLCERPLTGRITVPFCPESVLSGIGSTDFLNAVWYRREVSIPQEWAGRDVLLHFQAVDYDATVWVNGTEVARHRGGSTPITCPLKGLAGPGEIAKIVVRARDNHRDPKPRGKQSSLYANHGCEYTRTTGIWQTVWMEPVGPASLAPPAHHPRCHPRPFPPRTAHYRFTPWSDPSRRTQGRSVVSLRRYLIHSAWILAPCSNWPSRRTAAGCGSPATPICMISSSNC